MTAKILHKPWLQVAFMVLSLYLLGLMDIKEDPSGFTFQLLFAMLAPHIFPTHRALASVPIHFILVSVLFLTGLPALPSASLPEQGIHSLLILLSTALSACWVKREVHKLYKLLSAAFYLIILGLVPKFAVPNSFANVWLAVLLIVPVLVFWRMRQYKRAFWRMAAPLLVYVPLDYASQLVLPEHGPAALPGLALGATPVLSLIHI